MYSEDEYLWLSGIQHFVFCRRQWALIHIEQQWDENYRTVDGHIMHEKVRHLLNHEKRGKLIIVHAMPVSSPKLGISGECDTIELIKDENGIALPSLNDKYIITLLSINVASPKKRIVTLFNLWLKLYASKICYVVIFFLGSYIMAKHGIV